MCTNTMTDEDTEGKLAQMKEDLAQADTEIAKLNQDLKSKQHEITVLQGGIIILQSLPSLSDSLLSSLHLAQTLWILLSITSMLISIISPIPTPNPHTGFRSCIMHVASNPFYQHHLHLLYNVSPCSQNHSSVTLQHSSSPISGARVTKF